MPAQQEGPDSILSPPEESDDEVFSSSGGDKHRTLPPLGPPPQPAPAPTAPEPVFSFASPPLAPAPAITGGDVVPGFLTGNVFAFPPPSQPAPPQPAAKDEPLDAFQDLAGVALTPPAPQPVQPQPKPVAAAPQPLPAPVPAAPGPKASPHPFATGGNPFADFPAPVPAALPKPAPAPAVEDIPEEPSIASGPAATEEQPDAKPTRARTAAPAGEGSRTLPLVLLGAYALVATVVAGYALFFRGGGQPDTGHPLSTIPDTFGEFDPVSRKKVSRLTFPADGELPPAQRAKLGGKVAIGQLEVQPVKVEKRPLAIEMEAAGGKDKRTEFTGKALVLTLDIKNTSPDLPIFPMDPAFTRREAKGDQPLTRLVVGSRAFFGGQIEWPLPSYVRKKIEVQQGNDAIPLRPGESREYVVFTAADPNLVKAAESEKGPLQWRVQVRRGLIEYKGKDVPVTAVIGVDFTAADIGAPG